VALREVQDFNGGLVPDGGGGFGVVGNAVSAEASMGIEREREGGHGADPEVDRSPVNAHAAGGGTNGMARNEAAENFLLGMGSGRSRWGDRVIRET